MNSVSVASAKKQAAEEAKNAKTKTISIEPVRKPTANITSKAKVKRRSQKMSNLAKKKKKLYCICQTPYDDSKYDSLPHSSIPFDVTDTFAISSLQIN